MFYLLTWSGSDDPVEIEGPYDDAAEAWWSGHGDESGVRVVVEADDDGDVLMRAAAAVLDAAARDARWHITGSPDAG